METQNITLAVPKEVLRKAKLLAIQKRTSLSRLLTHTLEEMVAEEDRYEVARQRSLAIMKKGFDLGTEGRVSWTREELHERR
jgi:hypothetical protein